MKYRAVLLALIPIAVLAQDDTYTLLVSELQQVEARLDLAKRDVARLEQLREILLQTRDDLERVAADATRQREDSTLVTFRAELERLDRRQAGLEARLANLERRAEETRALSPTEDTRITLRGLEETIEYIEQELAELRAGTPASVQ